MIKEYGEGLPVRISKGESSEAPDYKWVIMALNEAGFNSTLVDLEDVLKWASENLPEIYKSYGNTKSRT